MPLNENLDFFLTYLKESTLAIKVEKIGLNKLVYYRSDFQYQS